MLNRKMINKLEELYDKVNDLEAENKRIRQTIYLKNKEIEELKAELTYWKETADYWKNVAFEFERHNKHLKELNKRLDK